MTTNFDWIQLQQPQDYKFFACIIAQKLRNTNFKTNWRQTFLKTLMEQLKSVCSYRTLERIQKLFNEVAQQKNLQQKEQAQKKQQLANIKKKKLATIKAQKVSRKYNLEDEDSYSEDEDYQ